MGQTMKTVGDRIRQAREFRGLSGEELAIKVGYKTQSGISNLENRATGRGGFALPKIAEVTNFSVEWFLQGPDTEAMTTVEPLARTRQTWPAAPQTPTPGIAETQKTFDTPRDLAHRLVDSISDKGLMHAIELLEGLASRHPLEQKHSAGVFVPATIIKAA